MAFFDFQPFQHVTPAVYPHTGDHRAVVLRHPDRSTTKIRNVSRVDEHYHVAYEPFIFEA